MNALEQYRSLLAELGISADVAQANGFRLRPDYVYIPHVDNSGRIQTYRRRPVGSSLTLDNQFEQHRATTAYFARHPSRPKAIIEYLRDYSEPLILCESLLDSVYLQSQLAQSGINAQAFYIAHKHYPKPHILQLSTITHQKRIWVTQQTPTELIDHLRAQGAVIHKLKHSKHYADPVQAVRAGESLADMLNLSIKSATYSKKQVMVDKAKADTEQFTQWLTTLPRSVYSLTQLHSQYVHDTDSTIGKLQLSSLIDKLFPVYARRSILVHVPAVQYRRKHTTKAHTLIAIRQPDYWQDSSNAQWIAEYEGRFNTRTRIEA